MPGCETGKQSDRDALVWSRKAFQAVAYLNSILVALHEPDSIEPRPMGFGNGLQIGRCIGPGSFVTGLERNQIQHALGSIESQGNSERLNATVRGDGFRLKAAINLAPRRSRGVIGWRAVSILPCLFELGLLG